MQSKPVLTAVEATRILEAARAEESKQYEDMINGGRTAFLSAPLAGTLEGGAPVMVDGHVVGAVGVSGVKPDQDSQVARTAANSLNG
ncbi:heme-binding protein [Paraburkholderia sediminicola]|uniref:heme-binding protein n=1 Tax=Paraburkholderia sediminicola TaxID=458836 RepID=UPI0038B9A210